MVRRLVQQQYIGRLQQQSRQKCPRFLPPAEVGQRRIVLATNVAADLLIILTAVDRVYLNFGAPDQTPLGAVTMSECKRFIEKGHFPAGSMGPKVEAIYGSYDLDEFSGDSEKLIAVARRPL